MCNSPVNKLEILIVNCELIVFPFILMQIISLFQTRDNASTIIIFITCGIQLLTWGLDITRRLKCYPKSQVKLLKTKTTVSDGTS